MRPTTLRTILTLLGALLGLSACSSVGPEFHRPTVNLPAAWSQQDAHISGDPMQQPKWWTLFHDPVLNRLVDRALQENNTLEIAGLRVLEARAQLGIATGNRFPQSQAIAGSSSYSSPSGAVKPGPNVWSNSIGLSVSWELDFWGKYKRAIEAADAAYLASIAARHQAIILLIAQVVDSYLILRSNEELLAIAKANIAIQQRSYHITQTLYRNGQDSELDMQQAKTLLLSTKATLPGYELAITQARNALAVLLGHAPRTLKLDLTSEHAIPTLPEQIHAAIPADLLRRRPDVARAEQLAKAQSAAVGVATANLYPSFSLSGSLAFAAAGTGNAAFTNLFGGNSLTYTAGPSFVWPFFNYGRIRNAVRVEDARLQQLLVQYRETVIQAAREVEDAMAAYNAARRQSAIRRQTVVSAKRSNTLSLFRYKEGFSDYQRVLDAQKALFTQQQALIQTRVTAARSLVATYLALGGGWQAVDTPLISEQSRQTMQQRSDWGEMLQRPAANNSDHQTSKTDQGGDHDGAE